MNIVIIYDSLKDFPRKIVQQNHVKQVQYSDGVCTYLKNGEIKKVNNVILVDILEDKNADN